MNVSQYMYIIIRTYYEEHSYVIIFMCVYVPSAYIDRYIVRNMRVVVVEKWIWMEEGKCTDGGVGRWPASILSRLG